MKCYFAKCSFKPLCATDKYFNSMLGLFKISQNKLAKGEAAPYFQ
jgi:hypothetical protein